MEALIIVFVVLAPIAFGFLSVRALRNRSPKESGPVRRRIVFLTEVVAALVLAAAVVLIGSRKPSDGGWLVWLERAVVEGFGPSAWQGLWFVLGAVLFFWVLSVIRHR